MAVEMATILKGLDVVSKMKERMQHEVSVLKENGIEPCLAIVRIGSRPDDLSYEKGAVKRCEGIGIKCKVFEFDENISHQEFVENFKKINDDTLNHGILLFRPMPKHIDENEIKQIMSPSKDIDCLTSQNIAKVFEGDVEGFAPCTPEAVMEIFENNGIELSGKNVVVAGRSMVVGKPLSMMLLKKNATITVCHTKTQNMKDICKKADILIAAVGKAKIINADYVSEGAIVIDVGINVDEAGNLCGDVDFESVSQVASYITPVPGGVGTVTTSVLVNHVIKAAKKQFSIK
jgi:methylenetetrahydrofolate dehydrogenase (NADP+) / methenyltetrahydrofolate cyclohydrolase